MSRADDAEAYAKLGWHLFPVDSESKRPLTTHGHLDASCDPVEVRELWEALPDANIGLSLAASGLCVVDIDPRNGGDEQIYELQAARGLLPRDCLAATPSGGNHFLMRPAPGRRPRGKAVLDRPLEPGEKCGVDMKQNGYVLIEPSARPDGKRYEWLALDPECVPPVPDAWLDVLYHPEAETDADSPAVCGSLDAWTETVDAPVGDEDARRLRDHLQEIGARGEGRSTTFRVISGIFHDHGLSVEEGWPLLLAWNATCGKSHPERELARQMHRISGRDLPGRRGNARRQGPGGEPLGGKPGSGRSALGALVERAKIFREQVPTSQTPTDHVSPTSPTPPTAPTAPTENRDLDTSIEISIPPNATGADTEENNQEDDLLATALGARDEPPRDDQVRHTLAATAAKFRRGADPLKREAGELVAAALQGKWAPAGDEDRSRGVARLASALVALAPENSTDGQLAMWIPGAPAEACGAVAEARACPVISIEPSRPRPPPDPGAEPPRPPQDDRELLASLSVNQNGVVEATATNVRSVLRWSSKLRDRARWNSLAKRIEIAGEFAGVPPNDLPFALQVYLESWGIRGAGRGDVGAAMLAVARERPYSPVTEYLTAREWDGVPRIGGAGRPVDCWLVRYCGADPSDLTSRAAGLFMVGAAARGLRPGVKHDTVLTLVGPQGAKKSTALSVLAGEYFSSTPLRLGDKDSYMVASSTWIVELAELASFKDRERAYENHKAFLSSPVDMFRPPYGSAPETFPRSCAFAGTTNDERYLGDPTGNRRHLSADVRRIDVRALERDRDQLWAEAVARFLEGEALIAADQTPPPDLRWWLEPDEQLEADRANSDRTVEDAWVEHVESWVAKMIAAGKPGPWTTSDVARGALGIDAARMDHSTMMRTAEACKKAGLERPRNANVVVGGVRVRPWSKP